MIHPQIKWIFLCISFILNAGVCYDLCGTCYFCEFFLGGLHMTDRESTALAAEAKEGEEKKLCGICMKRVPVLEFGKHYEKCLTKFHTFVASLGVSA